MSIGVDKRISILLASLIYCAPSSAYEMFLKAQSFEQSPNSVQTVYLFNGTIDNSKYSTAIEGISNVAVVTDRSRSIMVAEQRSVTDVSFVLQIESGDSGTYVVGLSTNSRVINLSPEEFDSHLRGGGLVDDLIEFEERSSSATIRERYSKHLKAIMQVGDRQSDTFRAKLEHPLEIIPDQNPYELRFGGDLSF